MSPTGNLPNSNKGDSWRKRGPWLGSLPEEGVWLHGMGSGKHTPSAGTGWSCSSASLVSGNARAPPVSRGGKTPLKPISEQLLSPASQPSRLPATPRLGMQPGVSEHNEVGQEGPLRPEAGSWPPVDFQAHTDVGSWAAWHQEGPSARAPQDATTTARGCHSGCGSKKSALGSCDSARQLRLSPG